MIHQQRMAVRSPSVDPQPATSDRALAGLIWAALFLIYLLTFSGVFRTIDELALYAMTESLAQRGDFSTSQIMFETYHNPVGDLEPGQAVVAAPLYAAVQRATTINNLQAVMLLNPIATALTAALLFLIGRRLSYSPQRSAALALVFGLATLAWPYARTFLREPLTGLLLTFALLVYLMWQHTDQARWLALMIVALLAMILVKFASAVVAPFFLLPAGLDWTRRHPRHKRWFIVALILGAAAVILTGTLVAQERYGAQFSPFAYLSGLKLDGVLTVVYGMLLSPGKGVIFYMPVILAAWYALSRAQQHRRLFIWISVFAPLAIIVAYANNPIWYGGQIWGPRFLVPVIPLMIFPLIDRLDRRWVWGLIALSFILQIGPVTADWALGHRPLNRIQRPWETTIGLDPGYWYLSPPFNQLRFWTIDRADLLWAHARAESPFVFDPVLLAGLASATIVAAKLLRRALRHQARRGEISLAIGLAIASVPLLLLRGWTDASDATGLSIDEARMIAQPLSPEANSPHTFVSVSNAFQNYVVLGFMKGNFQHLWYSPLEHTDFSALDHAVDRSWNLTLTIDRVHLPPDQSGNELRDWLNQRAYQYNGSYVGGYERFAYVWGPSPTQRQPIGIALGDRVELMSAGLGGDRFAANGIIPLQLELRKIGTLSDVVVVKTQLAGAGTIIGGHDSGIESGTIDPAAWPMGATVIDRRAFPIPADLAAGVYRLEAGLETPDGPLFTPNGQAFVVIGLVTITR
jgi:4-amino-4-deoxy-L-arabinose transferase-like glycosyltransferase